MNSLSIHAYQCINANVAWKVELEKSADLPNETFVTFQTCVCSKANR